MPGSMDSNGRMTLRGDRMPWVLACAGPSATAAAPPGDLPAIRARVLVADDDLVDQAATVRSLERIGCLVEVAANGAEAVGLARASRFDLILLDLRMPVMDGIAACRAIRAERGGEPGVPIVGLVAGAVDAGAAACRDAGMDAVLRKPVRVSELRAVLERWQPPLDSGVVASLEALGGEDDPTFVSDLFHALIDNAEAGLTALLAALQAEDIAALKAEAHRIKGAAANVGAHPLADACRRMEEAAANGRFTAALDELDTIAREIARVRTASRALRAPAASGATSR